MKCMMLLTKVHANGDLTKVHANGDLTKVHANGDTSKRLLINCVSYDAIRYDPSSHLLELTTVRKKPMILGSGVSEKHVTM